MEDLEGRMEGCVLGLYPLDVNSSSWYWEGNFHMTGLSPAFREEDQEKEVKMTFHFLPFSHTPSA